MVGRLVRQIRQQALPERVDELVVPTQRILAEVQRAFGPGQAHQIAIGALRDLGLRLAGQRPTLSIAQQSEAIVPQSLHQPTREIDVVRQHGEKLMGGQRLPQRGRGRSDVLRLAREQQHDTPLDCLGQSIAGSKFRAAHGRGRCQITKLGGHPELVCLQHE